MGGLRPPICKKGPEVPQPGPQSLVPSQGPSVCPGSTSAQPWSVRQIPGSCQAKERGVASQPRVLTWPRVRGKMLCDPDTHAGHRPDRERSKGEELINQMLLIFFKWNYKTLSISISIYSQGLLNQQIAVWVLVCYISPIVCVCVCVCVCVRARARAGTQGVGTVLKTQKKKHQKERELEMILSLEFDQLLWTPLSFF